MEEERAPTKNFWTLALVFLPILLILLASGTANASSPSWSQTFGSDESERAFAVAQASSGQYWSEGYIMVATEGAYPYSEGHDAWMILVKKSGDFDWNDFYGGSGQNFLTSVTQASDGGYIMAGMEKMNNDEDAWLIKIDDSGEKVWDRTYGGGDNEKFASVARTSDGGYILAGTRSDGDRDLWLVKTNSSGYKEWDREYGGSNPESIRFGRTVSQTSDDGYIVAGTTKSYGAGARDVWLIKTNPQGYVEWDQTFGGNSYETACSILQTSDGGCALAGNTSSYGSGSYDAWLIKTDSSGGKEWDQHYGGISSDSASSLVESSDGGYVFAGSTKSFGAGKEDVWLVKTNKWGSPVSTQTYGGSGRDMAYSVVPALNGGYIMAGFTSSYGSGGTDVWLLKSNSPPTLSSASVSPNSGEAGTTFNYQVSYQDNDSDNPSYLNVYIDGSSHSMTKTTGNYYEYEWSTSSDNIGSHEYYFEASDGIDSVRLPTSGTYSGPTVSPKSTTLNLSTSSFSVGTQSEKHLTATLTSEGDPLSEKSISWSATEGDFSTPSSTTDSYGDATVIYYPPSSETTDTITVSFGGGSQYAASSEQATATVQWETILTFKESDGDPLANRSIYYKTPDEEDWTHLGNTNSQGKITTQNDKLKGRTVNFKSGEGNYRGSASISSSGQASQSFELNPVREIPWLLIALGIILASGIVGGLIAWKKELLKIGGETKPRAEEGEGKKVEEETPKKTYCENCDLELPSEAEFCPECGEEVKELD